MKTNSAAILTIKDAPAMSKRGRKQIAAWLRRQAGFLEKEGDNLSRRFTARYMYAALLPLLLLCGCAGIRPDADPVVVNAERGTAIAFEAVDAFLSLEHTYRAWFVTNAPTIHVAAEKLRKEAPAAFASVSALTKTYKSNRTTTNRLNLEVALAFVNQLGVEASTWLARAQTKKKAQNYVRPSLNFARHRGGEFIDQPHPQGTRSRQAGWRVDAGTGGGVHAEARPEDEPAALAA